MNWISARVVKVITERHQPGRGHVVDGFSRQKRDLEMFAMLADRCELLAQTVLEGDMCANYMLGREQGAANDQLLQCQGLASRGSRHLVRGPNTKTLLSWV